MYYTIDNQKEHQYDIPYPDAVSTDLRHILGRIIVPTSEISRDETIEATNTKTTILKASLQALMQFTGNHSKHCLCLNTGTGKYPIGANLSN